jgi:ABC-2 type transport system permease protein
MTELRLSLRNFIYVFFAFVFPPMMLLLFGSIYGNDPTPFYHGHGAVDVLTPGYMGMVLGVSGIMGLPMQLSEYRQRKVLKRFKATPISTGTIMIPHFAANSVLCIAGMIILILVGKLVFRLHFFGNVFSFSAAFFISVMSIFSIGFLIAAIAPNNRAASAMSYLAYFPMLFLSGATMPLQIMPKSIVAVSRFIPLTYCVKILQGTWMGDPLGNFVKPIILLLAVSGLCLGASSRIFRWE